VADLIRRPLLSLTCGDMGITASEVETNFKECIELGERWGAVVLMDEADVYLEQRTAENLQRNSLVSGLSSFSRPYITCTTINECFQSSSEPSSTSEASSS
jgi:hypothetical protein